LGNGEQGRGWWQEERVREGKEKHPELVQERRAERRRSFSVATQVVALRGCTEGRSDAPTESRRNQPQEHERQQP
jgi:hypothetical protein